MTNTCASRTDPDPLDGIAQTLDRAAAAFVAQATSGLSPATITQAFLDWGAHLAIPPGKQLQLAAKAGRKIGRIADYAARRSGHDHATPAIAPLPQDRRFVDPAWAMQPFDLISQAFLLNQQWWHAATTDIGGVSRHHEEMVNFAARQLLDVFAPTNFLATNPVLQRKIVEQCLIEGVQHWCEDVQRLTDPRWIRTIGSSRHRPKTAPGGSNGGAGLATIRASASRRQAWDR